MHSASPSCLRGPSVFEGGASCLEMDSCFVMRGGTEGRRGGRSSNLQAIFINLHQLEPSRVSTRSNKQLGGAVEEEKEER